MTLAFKVLTTEQAEALRKDLFVGAEVDVRDGYIHLSTAAQVAETLDKYFAGQTGLWLAAVDVERCGDALRWEVSRGGKLFPHLYGLLTMALVVALAPVELATDGALMLPCAYTKTR